MGLSSRVVLPNPMSTHSQFINAYKNFKQFAYLEADTIAKHNKGNTLARFVIFVATVPLGKASTSINASQLGIGPAMETDLKSVGLRPRRYATFESYKYKYKYKWGEGRERGEREREREREREGRE
ncbi:hypothetical protein VNO77_01322 [Canavalia gladiata]|uniref:Uncharacterized protein n=1 Tax=Canavalia gladiata TaxID=3824 RepID=A0AAN9MQY3_CANGL